MQPKALQEIVAGVGIAAALGIAAAYWATGGWWRIALAVTALAFLAGAVENFRRRNSPGFAPAIDRTSKPLSPDEQRAARLTKTIRAHVPITDPTAFVNQIEGTQIVSRGADEEHTELAIVNFTYREVTFGASSGREGKEEEYCLRAEDLNCDPQLFDDLARQFVQRVRKFEQEWQPIRFAYRQPG
jgi:hypothetical protein